MREPRAWSGASAAVQHLIQVAARSPEFDLSLACICLSLSLQDALPLKSLTFDVVYLVIYPYFPLDLTGFSQEKNLIQFLANKMQDFRNFVLHDCTLNFVAEHVYLKL